MPTSHDVDTPVAVTQAGAVTRVLLQNAEGSNFVNLRAMRQLIAGLEEAHSSGSVILDIRSRGEDFSLGRDQTEKPDITRRQSLELILRANELLTTFPGVSVCLVQGRAFGFGAGLAIQSDVTISSDKAVFAFDEVLHQLAPLVVADYLPRYVGQKAAYELIFTGREVPAEEARQLGMTNRVVPSSDVDAAGDDLVSHLLELHPGALRLMKRFQGEMHRGIHQHPGEAGVEQLDEWIAAGRPDMR